MQKIIVPVHKKKLPFLDAAGLTYKIVERTDTPSPIMAKVHAQIVNIEIEADSISVIDYGHAMQAYGASLVQNNSSK